MNNHTPGPWRTDGRARYSYVSDDGRVRSIGAYAVFADDGLACVAVVIPGCLPARGRDDAAKANARLIAAAPDMLEALQEVERWCEARPEVHPWDTWQRLRAAIAKATGADNDA